MKEAIERCEAKHGFKISILSCSDNIVEMNVPAISIPATLSQLIELWNDRRQQSLKVANQIHAHIDMLIGCGEFKDKEEYDESLTEDSQIN
jgi:hypothetical protein